MTSTKLTKILNKVQSSSEKLKDSFINNEEQNSVLIDKILLTFLN